MKWIVLLASLGLCRTAVAASVTRGPYLQQMTPASVIIVWRTDSASDSVVLYGTEVDKLTGTAQEGAAVTQHEVRITGLNPETKYYYSIGSSDERLAGGDKDHFFRTAPVVGKRTAVRIWVLGDSGSVGKPGFWDGRDNAAGVRDAMLDEMSESGKIDLWLMLGDNAYLSGTDEEYQTAVFETYPALLRNYPLWPALGKHDSFSVGPPGDDSGPYFDMFVLPKNGEAGGLGSGSESYYSFDYAHIHFICLDSRAGDSTSPMLTWLRRDLAETSQDWIIAYFHAPPYTKGSLDSDSDTDANGKSMINMRQNVLPILEGGGVDLVLSGHSHVYERSFLLNGHYGTSDTLLGNMTIDNGDGRIGGSGYYVKKAGPNQGTVYIVLGTSAIAGIKGTADPYPAMAVSLFELGSVILDINNDRLDETFLRETGEIDDSFALIKPDPPKAGPIASGCALLLR